MKYKVQFVYYWTIEVEADSPDDAEYVASSMFCNDQENFEAKANLDEAYPVTAILSTDEVSK